MADQITQWIEAIVTLPIFLPLVTIMAFLDATIPVIPSEPVLSVGASWAGATGQINPWHVFFAALIGGMAGDNTCYIVGRKFQNKVANLNPKSKPGKAIGWVRRMMKHYGGATIIIARFVPYARFTLTLLLGSVRYNWLLFFIYDTIGVAIWAGAIVSVSYFGGLLFEGAPLIGVLFGVVAGTLIGVVIQKIQNSVIEWRAERRATSSA
ncbi:hypothetical protein C3B44_01055 [Corynebacterium yudongzhengii]|uniref:DedA family protein n=1 Tax=Corynebacterium yudongzhengii TaxID=2080740 RepID=A0A2U1T5B8_9CORY|nr:DedA family protein [Corynebacterium yudongzhengii]AWB81102.1 hypothetical protein C3B44_01055 [Corynebacterium yudongzhengii]PWC01206.1 DedA family protein [Corynebacterium yudongzhengii]